MIKYFFILYTSSAYFHQPDCEYGVRFPEIPIGYKELTAGSIDTIDLDILHNYLVISFNSCKGSSTFKKYNQQGIILLEGQYEDGLAPIQTYEFYFDEETYEPKIRMSDFFYQAIPNGIWIEYDDQGNIKKTRNYIHGILVEEVK